MSKRNLTISPLEFETACARTASVQSSKATRGARLVLILGLDVEKAATAVGCSRQAVNAAKTRVLEALDVCPMCGRPKDGSIRYHRRV